MVAMPRLRPAAVTVTAVTLAWITAACAPGGDLGAPTTAAAPGTTTTTPAWVGTADEQLWWAVDEICHAANDVALADAREVLTLNTIPEPAVLAGYYRRRADQIGVLVEEFATLTPPTETATEWPAALEALTRYAAWARDIADVVEADGMEADQTPDPGLESFRTLMRYGACNRLLDVN